MSWTKVLSGRLAADLKKEFKKDNPELTVEVVGIKDYSKQHWDETFYAKYTYRFK